jgi:hypothetical protein
MKLFQRPINKEIIYNLKKEIDNLDSIIFKKRKELKFIESPIAEKENILLQREQELRDRMQDVENMADSLGERLLKLKVIEEKEKILKQREENYLIKCGKQIQ